MDSVIDIQGVMRTCRKCNEILPLENFRKAKGCTFGRMWICKTCSNKRTRAWEDENKETLNDKRRKHYAEKYGPIQRQKERERRNLYPLRVRAQILRNGILMRAREFELNIDTDVLTTAYIMDWIKATPNCPCCGEPIDYTFKHDGQKHDNSPSIDRIRSDKGYIVGNVALICWRCNNLKRDATPDELQKVVDWMRLVWGNQAPGGSDVAMEAA